jgi:pyridoxal phosphate enzyme (YggS family)
MSDHLSRVQQNLSTVRARIAAAAARVGRAAESVMLVAVTKYVTAKNARSLVLAGCHDLGESRPQELWHKAEALRDLPVRWHLVGHLQRNKVRRTLPLIQLLHSADSLRLIEELQKAAESVDQEYQTLLEVNISGDPAKHGLRPEAVADLLSQLKHCPKIHVRGLMTMAALERQGEASRDDFRKLRILRDELRRNFSDAARLDELSMGMSGDFEVAIEEGATIVRVGSALFEGIANDH